MHMEESQTKPIRILSGMLRRFLKDLAYYRLDGNKTQARISELKVCFGGHLLILDPWR